MPAIMVMTVTAHFVGTFLCSVWFFLCVDHCADGCVYRYFRRKQCIVCYWNWFSSLFFWHSWHQVRLIEMRSVFCLPIRLHWTCICTSCSCFVSFYFALIDEAIHHSRIQRANLSSVRLMQIREGAIHKWSPKFTCKQLEWRLYNSSILFYCGDCDLITLLPERKLGTERHWKHVNAAHCCCRRRRLPLINELFA